LGSQCDTRLVGSLKLQVSFTKEPYKKDDILHYSHVLYRSYIGQPRMAVCVCVCLRQRERERESTECWRRASRVGSHALLSVPNPGLNAINRSGSR